MIRASFEQRSFFDELGKETVDRIISLAQQKKIQIIIFKWVINEAQAAVEKKVSKGKIQNSEAHDILFVMANFLEDNYPSKTIVSYAINEKVVLLERPSNIYALMRQMPYTS